MDSGYTGSAMAEYSLDRGVALYCWFVEKYRGRISDGVQS